MSVSEKDRTILRKLAGEKAEIGVLPIQKQTADEWRRLNRLEPGRPLVWINEIPWHEMGEEIALQCEDEFCRRHEWDLRANLYQWRHMRGDMVVEPVHYSPLVVHDSGFGVQAKHHASGVSYLGSVLYDPVIREEKDIEKIQTPEVRVDWEASERNFETISGILGDVLPVEKRGACGLWFAPWDILIQWWGVQEAMVDLVERPEMVHKAMGRLLNAHLARLDQYEEQNALSLNNGYHRVGSGGLGFTDQLPQPDFDPDRVRTTDLWGTATAQIFSDVSPRMHEEFALQYERRWLERFGLNCYGCCEPLHLKIDLLRSIPNLRRISMSPWVDLDVAVEKMGTDFIFSYKPNPAVLATDAWDPEQARSNLRAVLERTQGCIVEVILKDISTVRNEPERLWEWADIAMEVAGEFA
ncbi:MAG TPA: hypothetical protein VM492_09230 [Sumerlaeia bacterium]|nr:hypothetical protein [Sumerlaeia bacterium]